MADDELLCLADKEDEVDTELRVMQGARGEVNE